MQPFVVSARKYRPLRFVDVVGQEHVTRTLQNAIRTEQVAHAFLFCGPRGVGKTTCARVLAKVLNCTDRGDHPEPCNQCESCKAFNRQSSFNIIELDGASNNKVEHIRELIGQVRVPPQHGRYKVFIIDEVHMLSSAAFNAFLKTLEEPPAYAIFILATTEKHKLLPTILSRCQIFDFKRIDIVDMIEHLKQICERENIKADQDALHLIAVKADGALRDALSIFDRVVSFSEGNITLDKTLDNLRELGPDYYFKLVDACMTEDLATALLLLDEIMQRGHEPHRFLQGLGDHLRQLMMCQMPKTVELLQVSDNMRQRYLDQAGAVPYGWVISALDTIHQADLEYPRASHKRLHVETSLVRLSYLQRYTSAQSEPALGYSPRTQNAEKKNLAKPSVKAPQYSTSKKSEISQTAPAQTERLPAAAPVSSVAAENNLAEKNNNHSQEEKIRAQTRSSYSQLEELVQSVVHEEETPREIPLFSLDSIEAIWNSYADAVESPSLARTLRDTQIAIRDEECILITTPGSVAMDSIQMEKELLEKIRDHFQKPDLQYVYELSEEVLPESSIDKPIHLMSASERFDRMRALNPTVDSFIKTFDLRHNTRSNS